MLVLVCIFFLFFFFNDTATTEIYTLSLHDALPIYCSSRPWCRGTRITWNCNRSEEHTSELQSRRDLVCRLLLEKKKKIELFDLADKDEVSHLTEAEQHT